MGSTQRLCEVKDYPGMGVWVAVSDVAAGVCYIAMLLILFRALRGRKPDTVGRLFSLVRWFVFLAGGLHLLQIALFWLPGCSVQVVVRCAAAAVSVLATYFLATNVSSAGALKSSKQVQEMIDVRVKHLEDEAEVHRLAEKATRRAVEKIMRDFSHDLKEPVRAIIGFTEIVLEQDYGVDEARRKDFLRRCNRSAHRIMEIMEEMRSYILATVRSEDISIKMVSFDAILGEALERVDLRRERTGALIEVDNRVPREVYLGESIQRVLQNLLSNALKYSRVGEKPIILVKARLEGLDVLVEVRDRGVGFDGGESSFIFEPFRRLHRRSDWPGVGMGLTIARDIVSHLGGRIWASSDGPGRGASFFFRVPARTSDDQAY